MKNPREITEITLCNGTTLRIEGNMLWGFDNKFHPIDFTPAQRKILHKLAMNLNRPVSMIALYEAYADQSVQVDDKGISDNVAKVKNTIHDSVKSYVKSVRGYGYKLIETQNHQIENNLSVHTEAMPISAKSPVESSGHFSDLTGDYYGFFLDPVGNGSVLSAFFHIEKPSVTNKQQLSISAILGIRNDDMLLSEELVGIFSPSHTDYRQKFKAFISKHSANNKRCFWAEGVLHCHNTVAEIRLKTPIDAQWNIWLDLSSFLERTKQESGYNYKGGLGFAVALTPSYGTFCCRMGLVRTSYFSQPQKTKDPELQNMLKLSGSESFNPLMLDIQKDRYWYNWFMGD